MAPPPRVLVLDLGDVLFFYKIAGLTKFLPYTLQRIVTSWQWEALECNLLTEDQAIRLLARDLELAPDVVHEGLWQCRETLSVDTDLLALLCQIKDQMRVVGGGLKVYAMSNVSRGDFELMDKVLKKAGVDWSLFDGIFTSFGARMRKPDHFFYRHVARSIGGHPGNMIFVDDKKKNVDAAIACGMKGIVFEKRDDLVNQLNAILLNPGVVRAKAWLESHARRIVNQIEGESKPSFEDTFSQFLLMEATNDLSLLHLFVPENGQIETNEDIEATVASARQWNYFLEQPVGTTKEFPADVDSTSCYLIAFTPSEGVSQLLDSMLANRNDDNLVQTYWDVNRPRVDCCVLTNVVRAFYKYGRGSDVRESLDYVKAALLERTYISGTRHYCTPETFLFFVSKLVSDHPFEAELQALRKPLIKAVCDRVGVYENKVTQQELDLAAASESTAQKYEAYVPEVDSLAIAMRVISCQLLGIQPGKLDQDVMRLAQMQDDDGSWPLGWLCRYGRTKARIGNRGVVTAIAANALEAEALKSVVGLN